MTQPSASGVPSNNPRLNAILAEYMKRKDAGQPIDPQVLLRAYPDLADGLRSYFEAESMMGGVGAAAVAETILPKTPPQPTNVRETVRPGAAASDTASDFQSRSFGRYQLLRPVGEGAMGSVFLAQDSALDRQVALKIPKTDGKSASDFLARFAREAKAAAGLKHPNICSVFDTGEHEGMPFITMEFIDGVPLSRFVGSSQLRSIDSILHMVATIADAVQHAHSKGVIHRDLKPGNILIDAEFKPYVTDFGLARRVNSSNESRMTQEGLLIGTPAYMAPEQVKGEQAKVGPRSDVYSLGVILFELLTSRLPFEGSVPEMLAQVLRDHPPSPSKFRKDLNDDIDDLCVKMLRKDPEKRFASMTDVVGAVDVLRKKLKQAPLNAADVTRQQSPHEIEKAHIEQMLTKGQYAAAIKDLEKLSRETLPGAKAAAEWARKKLPGVRAEAKALSPAGLAALLQTAQQLFRKHDYPGVIQLLEDVPSLRRTEAMEDLLEKAHAREAEAEQLFDEIKDCERSQNMDGIELLVKRFLKLKPGNSYAKRLWETLQSYGKTPTTRRQYRFDKGRLQPMPEPGYLKQWALLASLVGVLTFLSVYYYVTVIYLPSASQISPVEFDDALKQGTTRTPPVSSQFVYLDDLEETKFDGGWGVLGKHGYSDRLRGQECPRLTGEKVSHSLFPHPKEDGYSVVAYKLDRAWTTFNSTVYNDSDKNLTFEIVGNGKSLWKSKELNKRGSREEVEISVTGVQVLELRTHCRGSYYSAWGWWIEPRLTVIPGNESSLVNAGPGKKVDKADRRLDESATVPNNQFGTLEKDLPEPEATLVGFDVTEGLLNRGGDSKIITSIKPLYRDSAGILSESAKTYGVESGSKRRLGCIPSYAVSAVRVVGAVNFYVNSIEVTFKPLDRISDPLTAAYVKTETSGGTAGASSPILGQNGKPSVGLLVRSSPSGITGLGLIQPSKTLDPANPETWLIRTGESSGHNWQYRATDVEFRSEWFAENLPPEQQGLWLTGKGPFGHGIDTFQTFGTRCNFQYIYLRTTFEMPQPDTATDVVLRQVHDDDSWIWINGKEAELSGPNNPHPYLRGFQHQYTDMVLGDKARSLLKPGKNTIAIKSMQKTLRQVIDIGLKLVPKNGSVAKAVSSAPKKLDASPMPDVTPIITPTPKAMTPSEYVQRGQTRYARKEYADAIDDLRKAQAGDVTNANIANTLAWYLSTVPDLSLRDGKRAVELANLACSRNEFKNFKYLDTLACAYASIKDFKNAVTWQQKALAMTPDNQKLDFESRLNRFLGGRPMPDSSRDPTILIRRGVNGGHEWHFNHTRYTGTDWMNSPNNDDWPTGMSGFGYRQSYPNVVNTEWNKSENKIYLRTRIKIKSLAGRVVVLDSQHDDSAKIYVNGKLAREFKSYGVLSSYVFDPDKQAYFKEGDNDIAVQCMQRGNTNSGNSQVIDIGLRLE